MCKFSVLIVYSQILHHLMKSDTSKSKLSTETLLVQNLTLIICSVVPDLSNIVQLTRLNEPKVKFRVTISKLLFDQRLFMSFFFLELYFFQKHYAHRISSGISVDLIIENSLREFAASEAVWKFFFRNFSETLNSKLILSSSWIS